MPRRVFLAGSSAALAACRSADGEYFGNTTPPTKQRLVFENNAEPDTLDPARSPGGAEFFLLPSLFEGLVTPHPVTMEPLAGMATHYEASPDFTRFTFHLRGHSRPRGRRLNDATGVLRRGLPAKSVPPDGKPAFWSDGRMVTASDFLFAWRRTLAPETAAGFGVPYLYYIERAKEINSGKAPPEALGVRAADDFSLEIRLESAAPFLLAMLWLPWWCPVSANAVESARRSGFESRWAEPGSIVVNGPFTVAEWRANQGILLRRNPRYYNSAAVLLDEVTVLPTRDEQTIVNLYKSGYSHSMRGDLLTPLTLPALHKKRDLLRAPAVRTAFYSMNSERPPFDRPLVRYALNMALDKNLITKYLSGGQKPATGFVPPMQTFPPLKSVHVSVDGRSYDVLSFDPQGARDLLAKAGYAGGIGSNGHRVSFNLISSQRPRSAKTAEILQRQWSENLGIEIRLTNVTEGVWVETLTNKQYEGMIEDSWSAFYLDPNDFLSLFAAGLTGATWSDPRFDAGLERANATIDPGLRMERLAGIEELLMRSMPVVPLYCDSYSYLQKPFVRGLAMNPGNLPLFKYAWIDTQWRTS